MATPANEIDRPARRRRRAVGDAEQEVALRVVPINVGRSATKRADVSRQRDADSNFRPDAFTNRTLPTPHDMKQLHTVFQQSTILRQCVDSYSVNINCFGLRVVPIREGQEMSEREKRALERWIEKANPTQSMADIRMKTVFEYEKYGFSFVEIVRDRRGRASVMKHAKASTVRMLPKDTESIRVTVTLQREGRDVSIVERRKFRRFQQIEEGSATGVFFKEFGDPRAMSYKTGAYETDDDPIPKNELATEILHIGQVSEEPYGEPRWIGHLPSLIGTREAEEVNLRYFEDNTVPPAILSISGGKLTRASFDTLQEQLTARGIGRERQHQILLIEAVPVTDGVDDRGTVTVKLEKLTDARQSDALFKGYTDGSRFDVMSCFRLAGILLGITEDSSFANAQTALTLTETQVFFPERKVHDAWLNNNFINHPRGLGLKTVRLESKGPVMTSPEQVVRTLTALNVMGGLTPRSSVEAINELLDLDLPTLPDKGAADYEPWMDQPIALVLKTARSKNTQNEQAGKGDDEKNTEATGNVQPIVPENEEKGRGRLPNFSSGPTAVAASD